jgi:hypothetical protein
MLQITDLGVIVKRDSTGELSAKFGKQEFLEIVRIEKPKVIYYNGIIHFFFFDGLVVCSSECEENDFEELEFVRVHELSTKN